LRTDQADTVPEDLISLVPECLDVDVISIDLKGHGYLLTIGDHAVIVVPRIAEWFRQNFAVAHELGHLAKATSCDGIDLTDTNGETEANRFAASLLMPKEELRALDWNSITLPLLAERIWYWGVSTKSLAIRLEALNICPSAEIVSALKQSTFAFLRKYLDTPDVSYSIASRQERAARRRFPLELVSLLEQEVTDGRAPIESLAFALGVDAQELDVPAPNLLEPEDDEWLLEEFE
jgi:Zn-dependent peptidase ImmA (M78 family)